MLSSIQYLRGIAALSVVVFHLQPRLLGLGYEGYWPGFFASGVDLFFVLSGFLMWVTTAEAKTAPLDFFVRRVQRIVPMYWIVTAFILAIVFIAPQAISSGGVSAEFIEGSFLFIPVADPGNGHMEPLLPQGWTLNLEMAFYVLFAVALFLPVRSRLFVVLGVLSGFALLSLEGLDPQSWLGFYANQIVLEFGFGILVGVWWLARRKRVAEGGSRQKLLGRIWLAAGIIAFGVLTVVAPGLDQAWRAGVPAALVLIGALLLDGVEIPFLRLLGDASYTLYLVHGIILSGLLVCWRVAHLDALPFSLPLFSVVGVIASVIGGIIIYEFVEKPITNWFKARRSRRIAQPATDTAGN